MPPQQPGNTPKYSVLCFPGLCEFSFRFRKPFFCAPLPLSSEHSRLTHPTRRVYNAADEL